MHNTQSKFILEANQECDPKYSVVLDTLLNKGWLNEGCVIFSQYFDSIWWLAHQLSQDMPDEIIGIYAGGNDPACWSRACFLERREKISSRWCIEGRCAYCSEQTPRAKG
jgi:hypothetical protein